MGDVMLGRDVARAHADGDWGAVIAVLEPRLSGVDLAFANLESPLTEAPLTRQALDLRAPPEFAHALGRMGFDLLSLANNHSLDAGQAGLDDTIQALDSAQLGFVGPSPGLWWGTVGPRNTAVIAFDETRGDLDLQAMQDCVRLLYGRADLVVVSIHWGMELEPAANSRQRLIASALAEAGADIVVGHGPHVLQEVEWAWGAGRGRPTLVAYSLGNALFDSTAPPGARQTAILMVEVSAGGTLSACALPLSIDPLAWDLVAADPASATAILRVLQPNPSGWTARISECP
jgi:poly-gamma-glutamate synthesis protein (capsule biosynthesis protein)